MKIRVAGFGVSVDGFAAGLEQSLNDPLGKRGPDLFQWYFPTLLGQGEALFEGVNFYELGYRTVEYVAIERATHVVLAR